MHFVNSLARFDCRVSISTELRSATDTLLDVVPQITYTRECLYVWAADWFACACATRRIADRPFDSPWMYSALLDGSNRIHHMHWSTFGPTYLKKIPTECHRYHRQHVMPFVARVIFSKICEQITEITIWNLVYVSVWGGTVAVMYMFELFTLCAIQLIRLIVEIIGLDSIGWNYVANFPRKLFASAIEFGSDASRSLLFRIFAPDA